MSTSESQFGATQGDVPPAYPGEDDSSVPRDSSVLPDAEPATELDPIAAQLQQLEDERRKLEELQAEVDNNDESREGKEETDARSVYVGNVEYAAGAADLEKHFQPAGAINRVNIMLNKATGQPKGFAYIEFAEPSMVAEALLLNNTEFFGRQLKVLPKRTNIPGVARGRGRGRGGPRGRGSFRGGFRGRGNFRGRGGRGGYTPY